MTQNLYLGADLAPLMRAHTVEALGDAIEAIVRALGDSDAPGRIASVAELVKAADPDLVALQEVAIWEYGGKVVADFSELLVAALGDRYRVAGRWHPSRPQERRSRPAVEIGNLVLARPGMELAASSGDYWGKLSLKHPLAGDIGLVRGWIAVDGKVEGRPFRLLNTHLEATLLELPGAAEVQLAQAAELAAGPALVEPVIVVGDLNSDPHAAGVVPTASRDNLVAAGFTDAWAALHPGEPGLTWRVDDEIADPEARLGARLDLVLTRGGLHPVAVELLGGDPTCRTASGRWPSDHLAVLATIAFV
jgi:endonuclease/exonuclease/phosphatase family metal-dependent hydrolase